MRLAYITNARVPSERANALQSANMCAALAAEVEVTLYHPARRNLAELRDANVWDYYGLSRTFESVAVPCLDLFHLSGGQSWIERPIFLLQTLTFVWALAGRLRRSDAAVYYSRDLLVIALMALFLPEHRSKMFFEVHTLPGSRWGRWLCRWAVNRISGVVAITAGLRELLMALGLSGKHILVAPDGVDVRRYSGLTRAKARSKLNLNQAERLVVYTGHLYEWKGANVMAEAVAGLGPTTLGLLVGGRPGDITRMRAWVHERGWTNIALVGHVPPEQVPDYQVAADVLVLPNSARSEISRSYTSPLKLFEYLAAGGAIVASDLPSLREVLRDGENALLVPADDPGLLREAIQRLLADPELSSRLAEQARRDGEAYTWKARAQAVLAFLSASRAATS